MAINGLLGFSAQFQALTAQAIPTKASVASPISAQAASTQVARSSEKNTEIQHGDADADKSSHGGTHRDGVGKSLNVSA